MRNALFVVSAFGAAAALFSGCHETPDTGRDRAALEVAASDKAALRAAIPADEALRLLKEGNARFAAATHSAGHPVAEKRRKTADSQYPMAIVVGCSDSRVPAEMVFDQNLGRLFVVRSAGNIVDAYGLGSVEYAVAHLGSRLIVVMGHEHCGAVKAALADTDAPGHVGAIVRDIAPSVEATRALPGDRLHNAIEANVRRVEEKIRHEADMAGHASEVKVVGAVYELGTGEVRWLD